MQLAERSITHFARLQDRALGDLELEIPWTQPRIAEQISDRRGEVRMLKLDVSQIAPIHGKPVPWSEFLKVTGVAKRN